MIYERLVLRLRLKIKFIVLLLYFLGGYNLYFLQSYLVCMLYFDILLGWQSLFFSWGCTPFRSFGTAILFNSYLLLIFGLVEFAFGEAKSDKRNLLILFLGLSLSNKSPWLLRKIIISRIESFEHYSSFMHGYCSFNKLWLNDSGAVGIKRFGGAAFCGWNHQGPRGGRTCACWWWSAIKSFDFLQYFFLKKVRKEN